MFPLILILNVARVARAIPSGVPTTNYRGLIQVRNSADNSLLGYISKNLLNGAQMAYDADISQGLIVDFTAAQGSSPTDEIEIATEVCQHLAQISRFGTLKSCVLLESKQRIQLAQSHPGTRRCR